LKPEQIQSISATVDLQISNVLETHRRTSIVVSCHLNTTIEGIDAFLLDHLKASVIGSHLNCFAAHHGRKDRNWKRSGLQ